MNSDEWSLAIYQISHNQLMHFDVLNWLSSPLSELKNELTNVAAFVSLIHQAVGPKVELQYPCCA